MTAGFVGVGVGVGRIGRNGRQNVLIQTAYGHVQVLS